MYLSKRTLSKGEKAVAGCTANKPHNCLRLAPPVAHPPSGIYETDELRITLSCPTRLPGGGGGGAGASKEAQQHGKKSNLAAAAVAPNAVQFAYTLDGTPPMYTHSTNPHIHLLSSEKEQLVLRGKGVYVIRAVSGKDGFVESRVSDFAFRLLGKPAGASSSSSTSSPFPVVPVSRKSDGLPPLLAVPLYERFAAEKTGNAGSRAGTSSVPLNRSVNASLGAASAASASSPSRNNTTVASSWASAPESRYVADHTAITAVRAVPCGREGDASVVVQNPALSAHIAAELLAEQAKFNRGYKPPLPSTLPGAPVFLAPFHGTNPFRDRRAERKSNASPQRAAAAASNHNNNNAAAGSDSNYAPALDEMDISAICGPLANAIAQQQRHENAIQQSPSRSASRGGAAAADHHNVSSSSASHHPHQKGLSTVRHASAMRFGAGARGPWSAAPNAGSLVGALPADARCLSAEPTAIPDASSKVNKAAVVTADLTLQRRACTPALMRAYAAPLDAASFPSPLMQLVEPVLPQPRRDATIQGTPHWRASVAAGASDTQLLIEELRARAKTERKQRDSAESLLSFAAVASTVPEGTPLCAAKPIVRRMERLAKREAAAVAEHSTLQMLWYDAREDQLKKKQRYVAKEADTEASFNELILTHDPVERAQDREYVRHAAAVVEKSGMMLPPMLANDYNCTATSFFPGSDIAQTSGAFLKYVHGLGGIAPFLVQILRRVPYEDVHLKLDSDLVRETFKSGAPADLNLLFHDFPAVANSPQCQIPPSVSASFQRFAPNVGHLLLALRNCVWTDIALLSEAPFLLLLQFCALQAKPATYALGDEWAELRAFVESGGEATHAVSTAVPHIAYEMAMSLMRRNLDQQHTAEQARRARQSLEEHMASAAAPQQGGGAAAAAAAQTRKRALLQRMSASAIKDNAERRELLREVDELSRLVQWKPAGVDDAALDDPAAADAAAASKRAGRPGAPIGGGNNSNGNNDKSGGGGADGGNKDGSTRLQKKYGSAWKEAASTFIADAMLAHVLREMERKLPRLFATVKRASDIGSDMYKELVP